MPSQLGRDQAISLLVERGVRFVLMMDASWDDHTYLNEKIPKRMEEIDQPTAALDEDPAQTSPAQLLERAP